MIDMNLYQLKETGKDFIVLAHDNTEIKITFADRENKYDDLAPTKEEEASFFRGIKCVIGLEAPVVPMNKQQNMNIFLDHYVDLFGTLRSLPFPFSVASIEETEVQR
jgi:hypothetical protein